MASKIRVRIGEIEVEYEGEPDYLRDGLPDLLQSLADLSVSVSMPAPGGTAAASAPSPEGAATEAAIDKAGNQFQGSINTIAARLAVKKGPDLVMAVLAHSELVQGKDRTTRAEITSEMRNATGFFKPSYVGNLSTSLSNLVKAGTINEISTGVYALSDSTKKSVAAKLSSAA
jgi:hypothetical protein